MNQHETDIIIAGGGTVGSTLALALMRFTRFNVTVVEAQAMEPQLLHPGFDARSVALAAHSVEFFNQLGIDEHALGCGIGHIQVSDQGKLGQCSLDAREFQLERLGSVVELFHLGQTLRQALQPFEQQQRIIWCCPDSIATLHQDKGQVSVTTREGEHISARLLVVAEGGQSATREMAGIGVDIEPYEQVALIANIGLDRSHQNRAYERFTPNGPLALLPLDDDDSVAIPHSRCSLVWSIAPEQQQELLNASDEDFLARLQQAFGYRAGRLVKVGQRHAYPLALVTAHQHIAHRIAVVGNASQSLHPIAGQGLNLALRDVEVLLCQLIKVEGNAPDPGEFTLLQAFSRARQQDKHRVVTLTDGLVRIFSNNYPPLVLARNMGLGLLNLLPHARASLARQAMGQNTAGADLKTLLDERGHAVI